jgi:heptosyltransferase-2
MTKVLVVAPSWVGDTVLAQSLFSSLSAQQPELTLEVLAVDWCRPLLERMPEVTATIKMPIGHGQLKLGERYKLARQLKARGYQQAIILPNSWKSALIPFLAGIPQRTGWLGESRYLLINDYRRLNKIHYPRMVERLVALAYPANRPLPNPLPNPQLIADAEAAQHSRARHQLQSERPILALCPGAEFGEAKRWPAAHYAQLACEQIQSGWQVWLFGSARDQAVSQTISSLLPSNQQACCQDLTGRTSLTEVIDLLAISHAVVSNDSGLMHIAAALNRPLVALYGSTSPDFTPPLSPQARILKLDLACSPCFQRQCPLGHQHCLTQLQPSQVSQALAELTGNKH